MTLQQAYNLGRKEATDALMPDLRERDERIAELEAEQRELLHAARLALNTLDKVWNTVDHICGADRGDPLPVESLPDDRQQMVYDLVELVPDTGHELSEAIRKAEAPDDARI